MGIYEGLGMNPSKKNTFRNEYIFEFILKKSEVTLPLQYQAKTNRTNWEKCGNPIKFKGFSELSKCFGISRSRVADIFHKELNKMSREMNHRLYGYHDPRREHV